MHRLARALVRDADLAQDVAQDTLVVALEEGASGRRGPARAWLAGVARNLAAHAVRRRRERAERELYRARPAAGDPEGRTTERLRLHRVLTDAVASLPEPYRTAVTLRYFEGLAPRAIARQRGQNAATVRQHVHRGLEMLRQRLDREFGERRGWVAAFGLAGIGGATTVPLALLTVFAMKKLAFAGALVLGIGSLWLLQRTEPPPVPRSSGPTAQATAAATGARSPDSAGTLPAPARREAVSTPVAPVTPDAFTVRVADAGGHPFPGAIVVACPEGGEAAERRTTGPSGDADFEPHAGAGFVLVKARSRMPELRQVARLTGELSVVLGGGSRVSGIVLVDGAPARTGVRLSLHGAVPTTAAPPPAPIVEELGVAPWQVLCRTTTDAQGRFAFEGLAADWSGSLGMQHNHLLVPQAGQDTGYDGRRLLLAAPRTDLVVATTLLPTVSGRVVWDDTGEPVPAPEIDCWGEFADGNTTPLFGVLGDEQGRFAAGFLTGTLNLRDRWSDPARRAALTKAVLHVSAPGSDGRTAVELDEARLQAGGEVVVRLRRAAITHFLVIDAKGAPIAGARVQCRRLSAPTGADGRGSFGEPRSDYLVGARGYQVVPAVPRAPATGTGDDPLVYVLSPANRLVLRLRTPAGSVPAARHVELRAAQDLFAGGRFQRELDRRLGASRADCSRSGKRMPDGSYLWRSSTATIQADARGEVLLHSLEPGVRCTVVVEDAVGTELLAQELVLPALGTTREVDLLITAQPRPFRGRVTTHDGAPLAGANVSLHTGPRDGHTRYANTRSSADGTFVFDQVYTDAPVRVVARHQGFAPQQRDQIVPTAGGEEVVFRLPPARRVTVRVVDHQGMAVPVHATLAPGDDLHDPPQWTRPGESVFADLPPGVVTFVCSWEGRHFELKHDTAQEEAVFRVP